MKKNRIFDIPGRAINKLRRQFFQVDSSLVDSFLKEVPGVIHIGANTGQEREYYASLGLNVLWVEPIPAVFEVLRSNISGFANQRACRHLLAAEHGVEYTLHIADNDGASSSIFNPAKHRKLHPDIHFVQDLRITATTLTHLIEADKIELSHYGALVLDTQGSELLVLQGAIPVLHRFRFIKMEAADFESYAGCCRIDELTDFMNQQGFAISQKVPVVTRKGVGTYYEAVFHRP